MPRSRNLVWDGCVNVRDLGGHPTEDGSETRFGAVVRADSVRGLSDDGWKALVGYGVRTIVDLRWPEELAEDPLRELPVSVVHVPLFGEREAAPEVDELVKDLADPAERRRLMYLEFLRRHPANFASAIAAVGRAPEGTVLVHCAGGVDRTGLVAAFLLRLAGVAPQHIAADYAVSEGNWGPRTATWIAEAADAEQQEWRRFMARVPAEAMLGVLLALDEQHGGVRDYLLAAGIGHAELAHARTRLRQ